jgi:magnesium chelatase family protein
MSLAIVHSRAQNGIDAPKVTVEVHLANGLPSMSIVGLPEAAVKESKDRVRSAIINSRFEFPARRITINLAPADLPKDGGRFDLPIAIGILAASGQIDNEQLSQYEFLGELALTGELRPIRGALSAAMETRLTGRALLVPDDNATESSLASDVTVFAAKHLLGVTGHLSGASLLGQHDWVSRQVTDIEPDRDMQDVRGQYLARRALEISAAGGHNLLFIGPPGAGKTMLATRLPGILPPMSEVEAMESAAIQSISDKGFDMRHWRQRPFRAPHHTASGVALVGGGSYPRPGEVSLAHNGVLFLDELPEFDRRVLEVLREPLESGVICISRAARQSEFPARFQLLAAMNPCPCGYAGDPGGRCHCSADQISRYRSRVSGPLLDRIDLHVHVSAIPVDQLLTKNKHEQESSAQIRARVIQARKMQYERNDKANAFLNNTETESVIALANEHRVLLNNAMNKLKLSARAYHRILRVARTIADLAGEIEVSSEHLGEAIGFRSLEKY